MKNAIEYYYNLKPETIRQVDKIFKFSISNIKYVIMPILKTKEEINEIYKLHNEILRNGYYCHNIILNVNKEITTIINGIEYILIRDLLINRKIDYQDIKAFSNTQINYKNFPVLTRKKWHTLWSKKMDYLEYQISQFGKKYPIIRESSSYFIGIVENCISILANIETDKNVYSISHDRINVNYTVFDLYNPINFIIDKRVRDIGETIKINILSETDLISQIEKNIKLYKLNEQEIIMLFLRIIYPSVYLDICEQIIDMKKKEVEIYEVINRIGIYESNIKIIYDYIRRITKIPEIEWLKKM